MPTGQLKILGAVYGLANVTGTVASMVNTGVNPQTLSVQASNSVFGDSWPNYLKALTVVYQYDDNQPQVAACPENAILNIAEANFKDSVPAKPSTTTSPLLTLYGCTYGFTDVTSTVLPMINSSQGLSFVAGNSTFGDTWPGVVKTCVLVYSYTSAPQVLIVQENQTITLTAPVFTARQIDTASKGYFVVCVDSQGNVWQSSQGNWIPSNQFGNFPPNVQCLNFGENVDLWLTAGTSATDNPVYSLINQSLVNQSVSAVQVSSGRDGETWLVTSAGQLQRYEQTQGGFYPQPGQLTQLAVVSQDLQWGLDNNNNILNRTIENQAWTIVAPGPTGAPITSLAASEDGNLFVVTGDGLAWMFTGDDQIWLQIGGGDLAVSSLSIRDFEDAWCITTDGIPLYMGSPTQTTARVRVDIPFHSVQPMWDTESVYDETLSTHLYIVNRGAQLAATDSVYGAFINANLQPMVGQPPQPPPPDNSFRAGLCHGLYDADFKAPYNNPSWVGQPTYKSHFYDDDTKNNYMGETTPTALTNGVKFFNASIAAMNAGNAHDAGYNLGLALHYFTDLTQPMHSANYTYLDSWPWGYHTDFETYMLNMQSQVVPQPTITGFSAGTITDPGALYIMVSKFFKSNYFNQIDQAHKYLTWKTSPDTWQKAVLPLFTDILNNAVQDTAQLMYIWATLTAPSRKETQHLAAASG